MFLGIPAIESAYLMTSSPIPGAKRAHRDVGPFKSGIPSTGFVVVLVAD